MKLKWLRKSILMQLSVLAVLFCFSNSSFARISAFSRANCGGINESLTWEASGIFTGQSLYVESVHFPTSSTFGSFTSQHSLSDGGSSWRARAGDQNDTWGFNTATCPRTSTWNVFGYHSYYDPDRNAQIDLGTSFASNCNLSQW